MKVFFTSLLLCVFFFGFSQQDSLNRLEPNNQEKALAKALSKGDDFFFVGNFRDALPLFKQAETSYSNDALFNFKIGVCYFKLGKLKDALPYFQKAKTLDAKVDPKVDYALGQSYQASGMYEKAIESYNAYLNSLSDTKKNLEKPKVETEIATCKKMIKGSDDLTQNPSNKLSEESLTNEKTTENLEQADVSKSSVKQGVSYRIQIVSASEPLSKDKLKAIYPGPLSISHEKIGKTHKYFIGDFKSKSEALKARSLSGVDGAFLVRFKNGKKM